MQNQPTRPATSPEDTQADLLGLGIPRPSPLPAFLPRVEVRRSPLGGSYRARLFDSGHRLVGIVEETTRAKAIESACELAEQLRTVA